MGWYLFSTLDSNISNFTNLRISFLYSVSHPSLFADFVFSRPCSRLRQGLHYFGCLKANETFLERIDLVQALVGTTGIKEKFFSLRSSPQNKTREIIWSKYPIVNEYHLKTISPTLQINKCFIFHILILKKNFREHSFF